MTDRLIDLLCPAHRAETLGTRCWPAAFPFCDDCATVNPVPPPLPGIDPAREMAIHEAGHAVLFLDLGIHVIEVSAGAGHGYAAFTNTVDYDQSNLPGLIGRWAGQAATMHWLRETGQLDDAATVDLAAVSRSDTAAILTHGHTDLIFEARGIADRMSARRWPAIEAVAELLIARGSLTAAEVAAVDLPALAAAA